MSLYQTMCYRRAFHMVAGLGSLLALSATLSGCSHIRSWASGGSGETSSTPVAAIAPAPASDADAGESPEPPQTVTAELTETGDETATVLPDVSTSLSPTAPKSYVVQRGDTLWGLAGMFLKDPWLWPEIWYVNPEVSNPHRIYPGDTLRLAFGADGKQVVQLIRGGGATRLRPLLRSTALDGPLANIPYSAIAAFLSRPGVLTTDQVKAAPYVLALRDRHLIAGSGNDIYVRKLTAADGERFSVMHVGQKLKDPDGGKTLGYLALYSGVAQVTRAGDPARAQISESAREILTGDVLMPEAGGADFVPHLPTAQVNGRILAIVNGVLLAGQYQVVAINRGSQHGLEPGHILRVNEAEKSVLDRCARITGVGTCTHYRNTSLPAETAGALLVFQVFDHVSYGLVVSERVPLGIGDHVLNP